MNKWSQLPEEFEFGGTACRKSFLAGREIPKVMLLAIANYLRSPRLTRAATGGVMNATDARSVVPTQTLAIELVQAWRRDPEILASVVGRDAVSVVYVCPLGRAGDEAVHEDVRARTPNVRDDIAAAADVPCEPANQVEVVFVNRHLDAMHVEANRPSR